MGLPIERIIVAINANDIVARALETGRYARGDVPPTPSPAMDIQVASNFERLYFEAVERDAAGDRAAPFGPSPRMRRASTSRRTALAAMRGLFAGAAVSEAETARTILATFNETGELVDPHTAVGLAAAARIGPADAATPLVVLSTAHPAKFPEAVRGRDRRRRRPAAGLGRRWPPSAERFDRSPPTLEAVKAYRARRSQRD